MRTQFSPFSSLRHRDYRLFWFGSTVSNIGTQMQTVAVGWHVYQLTHSALALGLVGLASYLPVMIFSLVGGLTADQYNRKYILITAQTAQAIFALVLTAFSFTEHTSVLLIYTVLALNAVSVAFSGPARQSITPHLVPHKDFINAVTLNTLGMQTASVLGPAIGGFIIALYGVGTVYLINTLSFFVLIFMLFPITVPHMAESKRAAFSLVSLKEGFSFIWKTPILSSTFLVDFLANFFASATSLMPIFATDILKTGAHGLGFLYAAPSIGAVLAGLTVSGLGHFKNQGKIIVISIIIYGLATIGFGLSSNFALSIFFLMIFGAADTVSLVLRVTIRQLITPDHMRGRVGSFSMIFNQGGPKLGDTEAGIVAALVGAPASVVLGGVATIIATLIVAAKIPSLHKYQGKETGL